ncbi:cytochrome P450 [Bimuria novae-zelandiae CBS 107.79]|uniref:Cytochrome P450 n=1 Tax=Bimuria novae-zelandiae CBS 107.79 TaxID=1447943 RepID=A0A6A5VGY0_9PLEO|nr:cytochrome P450 [Bimuria novae-zelandiae CBS 107.79]
MDVPEMLSVIIRYILYAIIIVYTYRILFHPLHYLPGPFMETFTDWHGAFYAIRKNLSLQIYRNHQKYGQGINDRAMREFEPLMLTPIDIFIKELAKSTKGENIIVDMTDRCRYLGFDIIGQLSFGTALNMQTSTANRFMLSGMDTSNFRINLYMRFLLLKRAGMELILYPFILTSQMAYYKKLRDLIIARRAEGKHTRKDLYSFVVDAKDPDTGEGMRLRDIWSEAAFSMPAGGDTTSTALAGAFFYLSRYPDCYGRLAQEIRSTFTSGSEIRHSTRLSSCTYLHACIDEAISNNEQPLVIKGQVIPPGTEVGVNIYTIHHNEEYFPDSYASKPERWLDKTPERKKLMHDAFTAFSLGPLGCGGKAMAYRETCIAIAKTFWYLDFERLAQDGKAN